VAAGIAPSSSYALLHRSKTVTHLLEHWSRVAVRVLL
jgi:hypothetical protein